MRDEEKKLLRHNAAQIGKYLEFRDPITMKNTAGSYFNNESDRKGESRVTMSEKGHIFWSDKDGDNQHFGNHVRIILRQLEDKQVYLPAKLLEHDPTALRRWRAGETDNDRHWMQRFDHLCKFVASLMERMFPGVRIYCNVWPEFEEARPKTNKAAGQERTINKEHSYRLIGPEVQRVKDKEHCTLKAAIARVADMTNNTLGLPCSFPRVQAAYYFWKNGEEAKSKASKASQRLAILDEMSREAQREGFYDVKEPSSGEKESA